MTHGQGVIPGLGTPWVADTSVNDPLQSQFLSLGPTDGRGLPGQLQFELGFSTTETPALGRLMDSLTLSVGNAGGGDETVVATLDAFGLTVAPVPGSGRFAGATFQMTETASRLAPVEGARFSQAYRLDVLLPGELSASPLRAYFDFFHNGDLLPSRGYALVVPEPGSVSLLIAGAAVGAWGWNRRRNRGA